jgi:hypothetical protein
MKQITIRQFSQNVYGFLKELPLAITRYGRPYLVILSHDEYSALKSNVATNVATPVEQKLAFPMPKKRGGDQLARCKLCGKLKYKHLTAECPGDFPG